MERTRLAEEWLAAACSRMNGAAGLVMNQHARPEQVLAVISEYLLDSPALLDFIVAKVEATTELTNRQRDAKVKKLDAEAREHALAAARAEVEARFGGVAV